MEFSWWIVSLDQSYFFWRENKILNLHNTYFYASFFYNFLVSFRMIDKYSLKMQVIVNDYTHNKEDKSVAFTPGNNP